jgi:hypothetical protein
MGGDMGEASEPGMLTAYENVPAQLEEEKVRNTWKAAQPSERFCLLCAVVRLPNDADR